jgi:uncharacterized protein YjbJ (UPF0337 family)
MKPSTEDQTTGKLHEVKGTVKQTVGRITNDPNQEADGRAEKNAGKVQNIVGKVEKAINQ